MKIAKLGNKGFTIVELLIVIVIIGILATIGFVAFSGAQNKAKKSDAESTLSQVKSKLGEYYVDHSEYPASKAAVTAFLTSDDGGNNTALNNKFISQTNGVDNFRYACSDDGGTPNCAEGFTIIAEGDVWKGADISVSN